MNNKMAHRGPDAAGQFINENIGLGHRRLSIIDTEQSANQPMLSSNKNWVIAFNGEIYNYVELKANELHGVRFQTESDTEVILELFDKFGPDAISKLLRHRAMTVFNTAETCDFDIACSIKS
jgi:asparagine synthase (glutamine-hydrolysing)